MIKQHKMMFHSEIWAPFWGRTNSVRPAQLTCDVTARVPKSLVYHQYCIFPRLKPIFHCDAKPFELGTFASPNARDSTFALANAKNTNMLVSLALGDANFSPTRVSEIWLRWVPNANFLRWPCTFNFVCVDFIRVGWPTRTPFPVEYGLNLFHLS